MIETVDRERLQALIDEGAQVVDVLPTKEYTESHIPGAVSIPLRKLNAETVSVLDRIRPVIVYCYDNL